jgi:hypothetical protein
LQILLSLSLQTDDLLLQIEEAVLEAHDTFRHQIQLLRHGEHTVPLRSIGGPTK